MRSFTRPAVAVALSAAATQQQKRTMHDYQTHFQTQMSAKFTEEIYDVAHAESAKWTAKNTTSASQTGNFNITAFDEESMFNPHKVAELEAKKMKYSTDAHLTKYVVPKPSGDADFIANANATYERFAKDADQVELFFRKYIRSYPATVHVFGTPAEIAAFETAEGAKIPNNKLIVGRINANATFKHARDDIFEFFSTLVALGDASEEEIAAFAAPFMERLLNDSFINVLHYWRLEEELLRSLQQMPDAATNYELKAVTIVLERNLKAAINGFSELPWISEDVFCPTRQEVTFYRSAAEAGMW